MKKNRRNKERMHLFNGEDLSDWRPLSEEVREESHHDWRVAGSVSLDPENPEKFEVESGNGILVNNERTSNLLTKRLYRDCKLHIEFNVPENSNSGVYFMGKYEIQILDSFGEKISKYEYGTCGGIYARYVDGEALGGKSPRVNASLEPGEWQSYDIIFHAPRFDEKGYKTSNAIFEKVIWNGELIHENVEVEGPTRASMPGPEWPRGPLMLQGDHGVVAYRNIRLLEI